MRTRSNKEMVTTRDTYRLYKKRAKVIRFTNGEYSALVGRFMKFIIQQLLDGEEVCLPFSLGRIYIMGFKIKVKIDKEGRITNLAPSWNKTLELWDRNPKAKEKKQIVFCTNEHSDGYRYHVTWSKTGANLKHKRLYSFIMARRNKRMLHGRIMEGKEYMRFDGSSKCKMLSQKDLEFNREGD